MSRGYDGYYQGEITPIGPGLDYEQPLDRDQLPRPDGATGRKLELDAGRIPRPNGRLPETALSVQSLGDESSAHLVATLRTRIQEREERIATLEAEIQALQFVYDVAGAVGDGEEFELKQILSDEYGPVSRP